MSLVVQVIVTGLAAGGVYGIFAVGYSLIYRLTGVVYFAFGDLVAFGVFTTLLVAAGTGPVSQTSLGFGRFLFALAVGLVLCIGVGAATYVLFIEPYLLRGSTARMGRLDACDRLRAARDDRRGLHAPGVRLPRPVPLRVIALFDEPDGSGLTTPSSATPGRGRGCEHGGARRRRGLCRASWRAAQPVTEPVG